MFGSTILDVVTALVLVYLLLSLIASGLQEAVASALGTRAKLLEQGIQELFADKTLASAFFQHPQISALYRGSYEDAKSAGTLPSYIPSKSFALALMDITARGQNLANALEAGAGATVMTTTSLRALVSHIGSKPVQRVLLTALDLSGDDIAQVQASLETWFNSSMDRVSGWYKRQTRTTLFVIGVILAAGGNVDSIQIANRLYRDAGVRQAAVAMASSMSADSSSTHTTAARTAVAHLDSLHVIAPWPGFSTARLWPAILGWLVTAFAVSLGAPFWFDALGRVVSIRSSTKPPNAATSASALNTSVASTSAHTGGTVKTVSPTPAVAFRAHEWMSGNPQSGVV